MFRKTLIVILTLLLPFLVQAKKKKRKWTTQDIVSISDSLLSATMGDSLFHYCKADESSYYSYGKGRYSYFIELLPSKKLNKQFMRAHVIYNFSMPWGHCPAYDTVAGRIDVYLTKNDSSFNFESTPDVSFIPREAASGEACEVISREQAIAAALEDSLVRGVNAPYAELMYRPDTKMFVWAVFSLIWNERDFNNSEEPKKDLVVIDAVSGKVMEHKKIPYTMHASNIFK